MHFRKHAVFTSCGDRSKCFELWSGKNRKYDLICSYYGNDNQYLKKYSDNFDIVFRRKGAKFQNFFYFYRQINFLKLYERIFFLDDDIILNTNEINDMFDFSKAFDLEICQPSFSTKSKISHWVTKQKEKNPIGRYTNFIEMNTPLMTKKAINNFDSIFDNSLSGYGTDYLFIWINNNRQIPSIPCRKFAINDEISCINPDDRELSKEGREIDKMNNLFTRQQAWKTYSDKISCPYEWEPISLGKILPIDGKGL